MAELKLALKVDDLDNVATIFANGITDGTAVEVRDKKGEMEEITLRDIRKGEHIMKYGECIGAASCDIRKGDYVHVHNLEALRGRGDLEGGDKA